MSTIHQISNYLYNIFYYLNILQLEIANYAKLWQYTKSVTISNNNSVL